MTDFLHGVETLEQKQNPTVSEVNKSIIGIVGTMPTFLLDEENKSVNKIQVVRNYQDLAKYVGKDLLDYTLPDAIKTILDESQGATIYFVNVFDESEHVTSVEEATATVVNDKIELDKIGVVNLVVKVGETAGVEGTDYQVVCQADKTVVELLSDDFKDVDAEIKIAYDYADVSKVSSADIIGTVDEDGVATGMQLLKQVSTVYGDEIGIMLVPVYSATDTVRSAMATILEKIKGFGYCDAPEGVSVNKAIQARQTAVEGIDLTGTEPRLMTFVGYQKRYSADLDTVVARPTSPVAAGKRVYLDKTESIAKSLTNTRVSTCKGLDIPVTFKLNDASTESNALNSKGLSTTINYKGAYYLWGARNMSYPNETGLMTFECARRVADFIEDSIEQSSFVAVGESVNQPFIDGILEMINNAFKKWKSNNNPKRIILDGEAWYDPTVNPATDLANGHIKFCYKFCPLGVTERITYYAYIDIDIFTEVLGGEE